jgi:ubiquinone/menaquinone biosynthesis C-methylase UbiE
MNQPPDSRRQPPQWRRPRGVAAGTWVYVNERSIADHYDEFVADTPLCELDSQILHRTLPGVAADRREVVLDLGCGSGRASIPLAQRGYVVVAVDLSLPMLELLIRKASRSRVSGSVCPVRANLAELACLADRSADHAICLFSTLGMIQGRANRRNLLRQAARIVKPRGSLVVHVHNRWAALREHGGVASLLQSWWRSCRRGEHEFGDATYAYRGLENMFVHRFSRRELINDLAACGWQLRKMHPVSIDGTRVDVRAKIPGGFIFSCLNDLAG